MTIAPNWYKSDFETPTASKKIVPIVTMLSMSNVYKVGGRLENSDFPFTHLSMSL